MRFIFILILSLPFYFNLSAQINTLVDTSHLRRHGAFFERNSIPISTYNFSNSSINNSLHSAINQRNLHRSSLIGGIVFAGLAVTAFSLIQPTETEALPQSEEFRPLANLLLISFGIGFTVDSGVLIIRSFNHQKKMKQDLALSRELLIDN